MPGQDYLMAQFGAAAVFILLVVTALIVLWKSAKADRDAQEKARREADANFAAERDRTRAEHTATIVKISADAFKAIEQSRAEFLAESRRRDDRMESQLGKFEERVHQMNREFSATVQAMHDKANQSAANTAAVVDALMKRLTT